MGMVDGLEMTATLKVAEQMQQRLEKELIGAWRAGYDYLYVAPDYSHTATESKTDLAMTVSYLVLPSNHEFTHNPFDDRPFEQYDLSSLTVEEYNEYV